MYKEITNVEEADILWEADLLYGQIAGGDSRSIWKWGLQYGPPSHHHRCLGEYYRFYVLTEED